MPLPVLKVTILQAVLAINPLGPCAAARAHANSSREVCCTHATRAGRTMSLSMSQRQLHTSIMHTSTGQRGKNTTLQEVDIDTVNGMPNEPSPHGDGSPPLWHLHPCMPSHAPRPQAPAGAAPLRVAVEHRDEGGAAAAGGEGQQTASVHRGQPLVRLKGDLGASFTV